MPPSVESAPRRAIGPRLHRSVSLEHDHASTAPSRPFILTACARRAIQRIAEGVSNPSSPRAWTLTGPFGTGKSSFCLFLSQLLSPPSFVSSKIARQVLERSDPSLLRSLRSVEGKGLVPVVVTGARESLSAL